MTLEEYLNNGVELEEMAMAHFERPSEDEEQRKIALAYSEGRRDVFKETLEKLSTFNYEATIREGKEMEHDVTLRQVVTLCQKRHEHIDSPKCKGCSLWSTKDDCCLAGQPYWIPVDEVEKRMKEEQE